jgi:hypothetical protein
VSLRVAGHVWNLRSERGYAVVHRALDAARRRRGFRVAAHVLRTPTEVRNALRYVAENHANHRERLGLGARRDRPDAYSSAVARAPMGGQLELWNEGLGGAGRTWLLREGERRASG